MTTFALNKETTALVTQLKEALNAQAEDFHNEFDSKSERWQDSERGVEVSAWIEGIDELAELLDNLELEA